MSEEPRKRRSHVLEYLKKQQEEREAAEAKEPGGDDPFHDFSSQLGLGGSPDGGEK